VNVVATKLVRRVQSSDLTSYDIHDRVTEVFVTILTGQQLELRKEKTNLILECGTI
jgi:hypothetical protein